MSALERLILSSWPVDATCCVGLSGGVDSVVLLTLLARLRQLRPLDLSAIHVNHGLSPHAQRWQDFCHNLCRKLDIEFHSAQLQVTKIAGYGLEASARKLRYQEYGKTKAAVIILAHHQDDQIETLLSQIMRGSEVHNLAAMNPYRQLHEQLLWRPLLGATKTQLRDYARVNALEHIEDESNNDQHYLRNFLRQQIIPQLQHYDSNASTKIINSLQSIQAAAQLNDELAQLDLEHCSLAAQVLNLGKFSTLSVLRQKNLLSYYISQQQLPLPSARQINEFIRQALQAKPDRHPQLSLTPQFRLQRLQNTLQILPQRS